VVPVNVVPLSVPVTVTPEAKVPDPRTLRLPDTVRLFCTVCPLVIKVPKVPVVPLIWLPVIVAPNK
jgi:hypothetical protein